MAKTIFLLIAASIAVLSPVCSGDNVLSSPNYLSTGQSLNITSYSFVMQADCNLVLYDGSQGIWFSNTSGKGSDCRVFMQSDGNLVIYESPNMPLWATNTTGPIGNYTCVLQSDRNVVVYNSVEMPLWATGTNITSTEGVELARTFDPTVQLKITPSVIKNAIAGHVEKELFRDAE